MRLVLRLTAGLLAAGGGCAREPHADPAALAAACRTLRVLPDAPAAPGPAFTWDRGCPAVGLSIYRGGDIVWAIGSPAGLRPPVRYGVAPAGAVNQAGPAPLERGVAHSARLEYVEREYEGREDLILASPVDFVP